MRATWSGLTPVLEGAEVDLSTVSDEEKTVVISDLLGS